MCLSRLTTEEPLVAQEDIVCYKVLTRTQHSPYYDFYYELELEYYSALIKDSYCIEEGFHSFSDEDTAKKSKLLIEAGSGYNDCSIYKCIIPQGSKYYVGYSITTFNSYASNRIKIIEKVN